MFRKNQDYSNGSDFFSNFKRVSKMASAVLQKNIEAWEIGVIFDLVKLDRICNIVIKKQTPKNEKLRESFCDKKNYNDLMEGMIYEYLDDEG